VEDLVSSGSISKYSIVIIVISNPKYYLLDYPRLCIKDSEGFVLGDGQKGRARLIKFQPSQSLLG
jgi:hypothetical protein